jgi:hypothetical protein
LVRTVSVGHIYLYALIITPVMKNKTFSIWRPIKEDAVILIPVVGELGMAGTVSVDDI